MMSYTPDDYSSSYIFVADAVGSNLKVQCVVTDNITKQSVTVSKKLDCVYPPSTAVISLEPGFALCNGWVTATCSGKSVSFSMSFCPQVAMELYKSYTVANIVAAGKPIYSEFNCSTAGRNWIVHITPIENTNKVNIMLTMTSGTTLSPGNQSQLTINGAYSVY